MVVLLVFWHKLQTHGNALVGNEETLSRLYCKDTMSSKGSKENKITRLDIFSSTIFSIDYLYIYAHC